MIRGWAFVLACGLALWGVSAAGAHADALCEGLTTFRLPHAKVTASELVSAGAAMACRIEATSAPTADSDIRIELWIPVGQAWNGKFVQIGNGGFAGHIRTGQLKTLAARGYAAAGTDDGHQGGAMDTAWARGHPQKVIDYGWRAIKETTNVSKALISSVTGAAPKKAYFEGCSDGGREAMMEAQRFPNDFDGIVAGAPVIDYIDELAMGPWVIQALLKSLDSYLPPAALSVLQARALADCGGGAFIRDPLSCRFDPIEVQCRPGETVASCLTPPQVAAARAIYGGMRDPRNGRLIYPGYTPGAEALPGSWSASFTGPSRDQIAKAINYHSQGFFRDFVFDDPAYDFLKFDFGADLDRAKARLSHELDALDPDLSAFRAHGGKLIQYHGWNDTAIPARASIIYYGRVRRKMGDVTNFYRLYMIPGMFHCGGGPGPSKVDWLDLIDRWVGSGEAPSAVIATASTPDQPIANQVLKPYDFDPRER